ncbi:MAG: hypothetical protein GF417_04030 [Candidatus Latescibacteria bacterium]|nr:hypothetical protein [bacterium]MBD3423595.1 hypothetical protein [Candidatus Latescibacterota bacterium]
MNSIKKILYIIPFLILFSGLSDVAAQSVEAERIQSALSLTDRVIEQATEAVQNSRSLKARITLEKAVELQNRARNRANDFSSKAGNLTAYKFTRAAREEAKHAIALARTDTRVVEKARRLFERTAEKLTVLKSRVSQSGIRDMRINRFIMDARGLLEKAHTNYSQMNNRPALKLAEKAHNLTEQADRRFRRLNKLKNTCIRRMNILDRLTARTSRIVARRGDRQARKQLATARKQLEKAKNLLADGRYHACNSTINQSEKLMRGLIRRINSSTEKGLEASLDQAWFRLEKAREKGSGSESDRRALEKAEQLLAEAEDNYLEGKVTNAGKLVERAEQLISKGAKDNGLTVEAVRSEYEKLAARNEQIRDLVERCGKEEGKALYQRAVSHMEKARTLIDAGKLEAAYSEIRISRNIFNRISEIC